MIIYRKASLNDVSQIIDIFFTSFSELIHKRYGGLPSKAAVRDIILLYMDAAQDGFIVAKEKDKVLGFIIAVENLRKPWGTLFTKYLLKVPLFLVPPRVFLISPPTFWHFFIGAHLVSEAVAPDVRHKGIGTKLAKLAISHLEKKGVDLIHFETEANNSAIKQIYSKLGFKESRKFKTGKMHWLTMSRNLGTTRTK